MDFSHYVRKDAKGIIYLVESYWLTYIVDSDGAGSAAEIYANNLGLHKRSVEGEGEVLRVLRVLHGFGCIEGGSTTLRFSTLLCDQFIKEITPF